VVDACFSVIIGEGGFDLRSYFGEILFGEKWMAARFQSQSAGSHRDQD
jgi:hypothetical protein